MYHLGPHLAMMTQSPPSDLVRRSLGELRGGFVAVMALSLSPVTSACGRRVCEDPKPVVDSLRPPVHSKLFSGREPPPILPRLR